MKEKINSFARGEFLFTQPEIRLSVESICTIIETGSVYQGSFILANQSGTEVKAVLYSSSRYLVLENTQVIGKENIINYCINAEHLDVDDTINGNISIISDCGEMRLPFTINIEAPACDTSIGRIKDLFQFANLAKADWAEAVKVFKSERFIRVLTYYNKKYLVLYKHLMKSRKTGKALEEFLIAIHKKLRITYSTDKSVFSYNVGNDSFLDKFTLHKDTWGYDELFIKTDAQFIELDRNKIWTEDFVGNSYEVGFVVIPDKMLCGNNYATIIVESVHQQIIITVLCVKTSKETLEILEHRKIRQYELKLTENYIKYKLGTINAGKYISEADSLLSVLLVARNDIKYELFKIFSYIQIGKENAVRQMFNDIYENADRWRNDSITVYAAVKYLNVMIKKDNKLTLLVMEELRTLYERYSDDWMLTLMMVWLDNRVNSSGALKFDIFRKQYKRGCRSPVMYLEAVSVINEDPSVLKEIDEFELQILFFGAKEKCFTKEVASHIAYIASRNKKFNQILYKTLEYLYEKYKQKDVLSTICTLLIKGHISGKQYHHWFEFGVAEQLRITELHEYFIYSADESLDKPVLQEIFTYFSYNSRLNEKKTAYLYANLITYKDKYPAIYANCEKALLTFAMEQLRQEKISSNLAVIYEDVFKKGMLNDEIAAYLCRIVFRYEISCKNKNIVSVCVAHKELNDEVITPLQDGMAQIDLYTENAEILLIDGDDNRYSATVEYTLNKLLRMDDLIKPYFEHISDNKPLIMHMLEDAQYHKFGKEQVELYKQAVRFDNLEEDYKKECEQKLIYYFYDNMEGELLESYLLKLNFSYIGRADRIKMLEFMIIRELYNSAMTAMQEYGYEGVGIKRLLKLASRMIQVMNDERNEELMKDIAYYVFSKGKYNEVILKYLVDTYNGATSDMYDIWKAARNFDLDTTSMEERLIAQMLFAESYVSDAKALFRNYYNRGANHRLIKASLSYYAYRYLLNDRRIEPELFDIMKRELNYEENDICTLALLKQYSTWNKFTGQEINFINHNMRVMQNKNMVLPFFKDFKCPEINIPQNMMDKHYVEYHTNRSSKVRINYMIENVNGSNGYVSEDMVNIAYGIFVKEFIIFYNEYLQYYITIEEDGESNIVESGEIKLEPALIGSEETKYQQLNLIITAKEMNDDKTVIRMLESYVKNEYRVEKLFHPI